MALPPPPSWLSRGPCDLKGLDRTAQEEAWIAAALKSRDARALGEATVASAALYFHARELPPHAAGRIVASLKGLLDSHTNAAYVLGTAWQTGGLRLQRDAPQARALFQRGWDTHANVGCVVGLLVLAATPEERRVQSDRLVRFALLPDCLERARATGSSSTMVDVLWEAAESLKADGAPLVAGATTVGQVLDRTEQGLLRLYDMAAALGDPHAMMEAAQLSMGRSVSSSGFVMPLRHSAKGEALCIDIAAHATAPANVKSCALGLLGSALQQRGEISRARSLFDQALRVCEEAGGKWLDGVDKFAVMGLTQMCYEAEGGPQDMQRGDAALAHGVRLNFGPSLELAAQVAERTGDRVKAAELWARAAQLSMPRAMAITYGISLDAAEQRIALTDPTAAMFCELGAASASLAGQGGAGGAPGTRNAPFTQDTVVRPHELRCAACGRLGRAAAAGADASALSVAALRGRLAQLRVSSAGLLEKSELVGRVAEAEAEAAARVPLLSACSRCKAVLYCNAACQRAHWAAHKTACGPKGA